MLIKCYFVTTVMVDTISSASNWSSLKFPSAIGIVHHVLPQHLDSYSDHATLFPAQVWGGIHENFISASLVHCDICVCMHLFDQFLPLIGFRLFIQQSFLRIHTFMTLYVTTLHVTTLSHLDKVAYFLCTNLSTVLE